MNRFIGANYTILKAGLQTIWYAFHKKTGLRATVHGPLPLQKRRRALACCFFIFWAAMAGCGHKKTALPANALFVLQPSAATDMAFTNTVTDNEVMNIFNYHNFYNGGGVAIGDINNDGLPDVFFTANQGSNKLFLNKGNWKFEDISQTANIASAHQWHTGVNMVDINADGWLDIYVCNAGIMPGDNRANELYINQKNGTFKEEAAAWGLDDKGSTTQSVFFDYDHDGDLDCFILNNSPKSLQSFGYSSDLRHVRDSINGDRLYRNDNNHFTDVSAAAGIYGGEIAFGLGVTVGDVNNDGWEDMYVSNDFFEKDYLYINQQNGTFKEVVNTALGHMSNGSMGSDMADINNDGYLDIFTTEMLPESDYRLKTTVKFDDYDVQASRNAYDFHQQFTCNSLQLNNQNGTFSEIAQLAGVEATGWSWGALSFDFDNDGWKDLYVCNGLNRDLTDQDFLEFISSEEARNQMHKSGSVLQAMLNKMPSVPITNYAFVNQANLRFVNQADALGFGTPSFSNGAAYGDLDGDGDLDLVVNNVNSESFVYRNMTRENLGHHYLKVKLQGHAPNTFGLGAKVTLHTPHGSQLLVQMPSRGFQSSVEPVLLFGLGKQPHIDSLVVEWPGGRGQTLTTIGADTVITLQQQQAVLRKPVMAPAVPLWFTAVNASSVLKGDIHHREDDYVDFDAERLLPKMLSTEGPWLAVADVNGDGLEDFFVGAATGDTATLFVQTAAGTFMQSRQEAFIRDRFFEDVGAQFFDADGDGDHDLVVASGGNQKLQNGAFLQSRLYLNNGKGAFTRSASFAAPSMNASCVAVHDVNGDGRPDVFIGARNVVAAYGMPPASALMLNQGNGSFTNATATLAPALQSLGMVTAAQWADVDADGAKELVVVGDWMPVTILKMVGGKLAIHQQLPGTAGWWNSLAIADINNDGHPDLLAGNFGLNSNIKAGEQHPARLYVNDFDNNGTVECVPVYYKTDGKAYPYPLKGELQAQVPELKKRLLRFGDYAGKPIEEVFTSTQLKNARVLTVEQSQTSVFINNGKGGFTMQPLPVMAQLSPTYAMVPGDFDGDGHTDIYVGGNFFGLKPQTGRLDANYGTVLLGNGKGGFTYASSQQSGLFTPGEVRDVKIIRTKTKTLWLVARNNNGLLVFEKGR